MEKTTQDKETKEKFEEFVTKECGGDLWGDDGTGHYEASLYDVKDKVWDFISSELDKAREEGKREVLEEMIKENGGNIIPSPEAIPTLMFRREIREYLNNKLSKLKTKEDGK